MENLIALEWRTESRRLADLLPLGYNPRKITATGETELDDSLSKFNLVEIPVINIDGMLIAGNQRVKRLAIKHGLDYSIDVRVPNRKLTVKEIKEYNVLSNTHQGEWDAVILESEFSDIDLSELMSTRDMGYVNRAIRGLYNDMESDDEDVPETPSVPQTCMGDVYELFSLETGLTHRVLCGDATDAAVVARLLGEQVPLLMVTDPPYGVEYDPMWRKDALPRNALASVGKVMNDDNADWTAVWQLFKAQIMYVWHAGKFCDVVGQSLRTAGYDIISQIIWNKTNGVISRGDYHWKHEPCFYAVRKGSTHKWTGARDQWTVWDIENGTSRKVIEAEGQSGHGTQKPLECMRRPILNNSQKGDVVADPFLGSGTTLIACEEVGRNCYGLELDTKYMDVIVKRWVGWMKKRELSFAVFKNDEEITTKTWLHE